MQTTGSRDADAQAFASIHSEDIMFLEPGLIRLFGTLDIGHRNKQLGSGWADPEEGHIWNDGEEVTLPIVVSHVPRAAMTLRIIGTPFMWNEQSSQRVTLYGNGFRLGSWKLEVKKEYTLDAIVEPEQWWARGAVFKLLCSWHLPDSTSPSERKTGDDSRQLGFCFRSVELLLPAA